MIKEELMRNEKLMQSVIEHAHIAICISRYDDEKEDFIFLTANKIFYTANTWLREPVDGKYLTDVFPMAHANGMYDFLLSVHKSGARDEKVLYYHTPLRGHVQQQILADPIGDGLLFSTMYDITELRTLHEENKLEQRKHAQTLNSISIGIITTDTHGKVSLLNNYAKAMFGLTEQEAVGRTLEEICTITPWQGNMVGSSLEGMNISQVLYSDGEARKTAIQETRLTDEHGHPHGRVYTFRDVSSFVQTQEELLYIHYHDALTGFFNRAYMRICFEKYTLPMGFGVLAADINGLKQVNTHHGTEKGDQLLMLCASAIRECVPSGAICIRFGEDDFIVLIPPREEDDTFSLQQLQKDIARSFDTRLRSIRVDTSLCFGTATVGAASATLQTAISAAQEQMLYSKVLERKSIYSSALNSLLVTLQVRSHETEEHVQRLNTLSQLLAKSLHLDNSNCNQLALLSVLHDIGKIGVPDFVLNKPSGLSDEEWKIMKGHSDLGNRILLSTSELSEIAPLVRAHHERWDGGGYPDKLAGEEIPLLSRIISIVDAYDAMTNDRIYRKALPHTHALDELTRGAGSQFDPTLVPLFVEALSLHDLPL